LEGTGKAQFGGTEQQPLKTREEDRVKLFTAMDSGRKRNSRQELKHK